MLGFQISAKTVLGQNLDTCTPPRHGVDFTNYTPETYDAIVKYKTAYYSFCLPVAIAMHMVSKRSRTSPCIRQSFQSYHCLRFSRPLFIVTVFTYPMAVPLQLCEIFRSVLVYVSGRNIGRICSQKRRRCAHTYGQVLSNTGLHCDTNVPIDRHYIYSTYTSVPLIYCVCTRFYEQLVEVHM